MVGRPTRACTGAAGRPRVSLWRCAGLAVVASAVLLTSCGSDSDWPEGPVERSQLDRDGDGFISAYEVISFGPREPTGLDCIILEEAPTARADVEIWQQIHDGWTEELAQRFIDYCDDNCWLPGQCER